VLEPAGFARATGRRPVRPPIGAVSEANPARVPASPSVFTMAGAGERLVQEDPEKTEDGRTSSAAIPLYSLSGEITPAGACVDHPR
jgi:hypothetical protein